MERQHQRKVHQFLGLCIQRSGFVGFRKVFSVVGIGREMTALDIGHNLSSYLVCCLLAKRRLLVELYGDGDDWVLAVSASTRRPAISLA